jgi:hypothetical protein
MFDHQALIPTSFSAGHFAGKENAPHKINSFIISMVNVVVPRPYAGGA